MWPYCVIGGVDGASGSTARNRPGTPSHLIPRARGNCLNPWTNPGNESRRLTDAPAQAVFGGRFGGKLGGLPYAFFMAHQLTSYQRRLVRQLDQIAEIARVDFHRIREYEPESRTVRLHLMKDQIVRSVVIRNYTWIDEALGSAICQYFFGERERTFIQLWRTQKFRRFNHYILETLSLLEKLRLVHSIREVPRAIRSDIEALNALRNGLAHAFFPQNLRASRPVWRGQSIFSLHGFQRYVEDVEAVTDYLTQRIYVRRTSRG